MTNLFNSGLVKWLQILIQNCKVLLKLASNTVIIYYTSIFLNIDIVYCGFFGRNHKLPVVTGCWCRIPY